MAVDGSSRVPDLIVVVLEGTIVTWVQAAGCGGSAALSLEVRVERVVLGVHLEDATLVDCGFVVVLSLVVAADLVAHLM